MSNPYLYQIRQGSAFTLGKAASADLLELEKLKKEMIEATKTNDVASLKRITRELKEMGERRKAEGKPTDTAYDSKAEMYKAKAKKFGLYAIPVVLLGGIALRIYQTMKK